MTAAQLNAKPGRPLLDKTYDRLSPNGPTSSFYSSQQGVNPPHAKALPLPICAPYPLLVPQFTNISFATFLWVKGRQKDSQQSSYIFGKRCREIEKGNKEADRLASMAYIRENITLTPEYTLETGDKPITENTREHIRRMMNKLSTEDWRRRQKRLNDQLWAHLKQFWDKSKIQTENILPWFSTSDYDQYEWNLPEEMGNKGLIPRNLRQKISKENKLIQ
ncbi:hypothetical protein PROFUN_09343 [Planoprotostelium fungivorum]|uniref:Uncharacterized protein n=1 Tax=Planoprotostelium fungivorum TaxID=1890364 RepID=A0A2P6NGV8_9EUKA|nr:hypothetical protein PROFUN_09343 [Planoprotostelium fungivorum]